jgi:hypothetical protein
VATFAGEIEVPVTPDTTGFGQRLEADALASATKAAQKIGRAMGQVIADRIANGIAQGLDRAGGAKAGVRVGSEFGREFSKVANAQIKAGMRDVTVKADVRTDTARARREIESLRGKDVTVNVDADTGNARRQIDSLGASSAGAATRTQFLVGTILLLGPALVPIAAAGAGAMAGIALGAMAAAGAVGVLVLALWPVIQAVAAVTQAQGKQANTSASAASRALQLANANDALKAAQDGVTEAVRRGRQSQEQSTRAIEKAKRAERDATEAVLDAEQRLADARKEAAQDQLDLKDRIQAGKLDERQAILDLQRAQLEYFQVLADPAASKAERDQAQLTFDQAKYHLAEIQLANADLAQQQQDTVQQGVEGSKKVQDAQKGVLDAKQKQVDAEQGVADAVKAAAEAQRESARSVVQAQQQVVQAQRALLQASTSAGLAASASLQTMRQKMAALTPEGRRFVLFLTGPLKDALSGLSAEAQRGFLPGLQSGMQALLPMLPAVKASIGEVARTLGHLADEAGNALTGPWWRQFFTFASETAVPVLHMMGETVGDLITGFVGLLQAMAPAAMDFGRGLLDAARAFSEFGTSAQTNPGFQRFLDYVRDSGPKVVTLLKDLVDAAVNIAVAMAPAGVAVLGVVDAVAKFIGWMNPQVLAGVASGAIAIAVGLKAIGLAQSGILKARAALDGTASAATRLKSAMIGIGVGFAAAGVLDAVFRSGDQAQASVTQTEAALKKLAASGSVDALNKIFQATSNYGEDDVRGFTDALKRLTDPDLNQKLNDLAGTLSMGLIKSGQETLVQQMQQIDQTLSQLVQSGNADQAKRIFWELERNAFRAGVSVDDLKKQFPDYAAALDAASTNVKSAADAQRDLADQSKRVSDNLLQARGSETAYFQALDTATESIKTNGATLDVHTAKGRANRDALDNIAAASNTYTQKLADNGATHDVLGQKQEEARKQLVEVAKQMGMSKTEAEKYTASVLSIPKEATTKVQTPGAVESKSNVDGMKSAVDSLRASADRTESVWSRMWNSLRDSAMDPISFVIDTIINKGIIDTWNSLASFFGGKIQNRIPNPLDQIRTHGAEGFASGGAVRGPGSGTSDSIPAWLSSGEYVIPARIVQQLGVGFFDLIRGGRLDVAGDPSSLVVRRFADGGAVDATKAWLPSVNPLPYVWGGVGPSGYDCSGLSGEVYSRVTGGPSYRRVFTTLSLLANPGRFGLKPGRGALTFGVSDTHMDGNLAGLGFEARGRESGIIIGSGAKPTSAFPHEFFLSDLGGSHDEAGGLDIDPLHPVESVKRILAAVLAPLKQITGTPWGQMAAVMPRMAMDAVVQRAADLWNAKQVLKHLVPRFADGGLVGSPTLYDEGGWLQPGLTTVLNASRTPEPVFSGQQWDRLSQGGLVDNRPNLSVQVHNPVPETASESSTRMMRRLGYSRAGA